MSTPLFDQGTDQLNFLLLSQRNMIIVSAFALALATFKNNFDQVYIEYLVIILFGYALAVGIVSLSDFNDYIKKVREEVINQDDKIELIDRWNRWRYFTWGLLAITILILIFYADITIFHYLLPIPGIKKQGDKKNKNNQEKHEEVIF